MAGNEMKTAETLEFLLVSAERQRNQASALMCPFHGVLAPCFGAHNTRTAGYSGITPTSIDMQPSMRVVCGWGSCLCGGSGSAANST